MRHYCFGSNCFISFEFTIYNLFLHPFFRDICKHHERQITNTHITAVSDGLGRVANTCKKKLNRKMLERPNICYIFEKLGVQGCRIWHSHVSIPFNSAPAHSSRPQNAKKLFTSSFQAKFLKIRFKKVAGTSSFLMCQQIFFFSSVNQSQGHIWAKMSQLWHLKNYRIYEPKMAKNALWKIAELPT